MSIRQANPTLRSHQAHLDPARADRAAIVAAFNAWPDDDQPPSYTECCGANYDGPCKPWCVNFVPDDIPGYRA